MENIENKMLLKLGSRIIDFGHVSLNKKNESICGDYYTLIEEEGTQVLVLSDGLGSGVKANILATLTAKMLGIMIARDVHVKKAVTAVAETLPICSVRNLAYATFTVLLVKDDTVCLLQYDNPDAVLIRNGRVYDYPVNIIRVDEKEIHQSYLTLQEEDMLILMSDGVTNAGMGKTTNGGWGREEVLDFCGEKYHAHMSAQEMAGAIANAGLSLNLEETDDDLTVLALRVMERQTVNLMIGPPKNRDDDKRYCSSYFEQSGLHIVCGGTTAKLVANYLNKTVKTISGSGKNDVPAMSVIEGVDYVTEGMLTLEKLVEYYEDYLNDRIYFNKVMKKKDAASILLEALFVKATEVNIFFGNAVNPGYEELNISQQKKQELTERLIEHLKRAGKTVNIAFWAV